MTHSPCRALPPEGRSLAQLGPTPIPARPKLDRLALWGARELFPPSGPRIVGSEGEAEWRRTLLRRPATVIDASTAFTRIPLAAAPGQPGLRLGPATAAGGSGAALPRAADPPRKR